MVMHPELMLGLAHDRHRDLVAEAQRARLLAAARLSRRSRRAGQGSAVRGQPTGTLTSCEPVAVAPAR
ncbi:hypothetical protein [Actinoplanes teichomyceticus]|uniref:Uncharacterized protein n=1 Tax=Actinoplanes teichomyceticus TaxID=1867 RepID=A0A561VI49_ACTTI|nr:hypothetical protein [Actinoplanes teichomyceticus]TWG11298.1 hypothetical protein FHX34_10628 [Actinoplanes teichomyceticus]GIF16329.1 hypothetical protein Ate01nite_63610 [Actinoplanes teichomyceticus]